MASLPPIKRITAEDFQDQKSWIAKLLQPLNSFFDSVYTALNKNLTFGENFRAMVRTVTVDNTLTSFTPIRIASTIGRPAGLWVVGFADKAGQPQTISPAVSVDWGYENGTIIINKVAGLTLYSSVNTNSSTSLTNVHRADQVVVGQTVTGTDIPANTTVSAVSGTTVTISAAATGTTTGVLATFTGKSYDLTFIAVGG